MSSLKLSSSLDCMFGYFGSAGLKSIAPGLAEYLVRGTEPMRLVVSPNISEADMVALRKGVSTPRIVLETRLKELLGEAKLSTNALIRHTLECIAYMLSTKQLLFSHSVGSAMGPYFTRKSGSFAMATIPLWLMGRATSLQQALAGITSRSVSTRPGTEIVQMKRSPPSPASSMLCGMVRETTS